MSEVAVEHVAHLDVVAIRWFADAKWEAFVDELLGDFFKIYVGVGWDVLVLLGDCRMLLCSCGERRAATWVATSAAMAARAVWDWVPTMLPSSMMDVVAGSKPPVRPSPRKWQPK